MIKPQLAKDAPERPPRLRLGLDWAQEPKLDGWRYMFERTPSGIQAYSGRNGKAARGVGAKAIKDTLEFLPVGTVLDSELVAYRPDGTTAPAAEVGSALARSSIRGRRLTLKAWVFDVPHLGDQNLTGVIWSERRALLVGLAQEFDPEQVLLMPVIRPPEESAHFAWLDAGMEGSICKRVTSLYKPGRRPQDWTKIKPQETADAEVIGWLWGKGESNRGKIGALRIRLLKTGKETKTAWSGTHERFEEWDGRLIEVKHHGWTDDGKVRHPVKPRLREDLE